MTDVNECYAAMGGPVCDMPRERRTIQIRMGCGKWQTREVGSVVVRWRRVCFGKSKAALVETEMGMEMGMVDVVGCEESRQSVRSANWSATLLRLRH